MLGGLWGQVWVSGVYGGVAWGPWGAEVTCGRGRASSGSARGLRRSAPAPLPSRPDGHHRPVYARGAPRGPEPARPVFWPRHDPRLPARGDPERRVRVSGRGRDPPEGGAARAVGVPVRMPRRVGSAPSPRSRPSAHPSRFSRLGFLVCTQSGLGLAQVYLPGGTGCRGGASGRGRRSPALQSHGRRLGQAACPRAVPSWGDLPGKLRPD